MLVKICKLTNVKIGNYLILWVLAIRDALESIVSLWDLRISLALGAQTGSRALEATSGGSGQWSKRQRRTLMAAGILLSALNCCHGSRGFWERVCVFVRICLHAWVCVCVCVCVWSLAVLTSLHHPVWFSPWGWSVVKDDEVNLSPCLNEVKSVITVPAPNPALKQCGESCFFTTTTELNAAPLLTDH